MSILLLCQNVLEDRGRKNSVWSSLFQDLSLYPVTNSFYYMFCYVPRKAYFFVLQLICQIRLCRVRVCYTLSFLSSSSHTDVGASHSLRHCVLCAQCPLWRPEPAARSPRHREHTAGEVVTEMTSQHIQFLLKGNSGFTQPESYFHGFGSLFFC